MTNDICNFPSARDDLIAGWTALWNGDLQQADDVCAPDVSIHLGGRDIGSLGDSVRTPAQLAALIGDFRATRPGLRYEVVEQRTTPQWGWCVWDAAMGALHVGGIDTFAFGPRGIERVWSVTAQRPMSLPL